MQQFIVTNKFLGKNDLLLYLHTVFLRLGNFKKIHLMQITQEIFFGK